MRHGAFVLSRGTQDALAILALDRLRHEPVRAREIATAIGRQATSINQTLRILCATGLLLSRRGSQGGFWLPPGRRISALDAVRAIAPFRRFAPCRCASPCRLCAVLDATTRDLERALDDCALVPTPHGAGQPCTCVAASVDQGPQRLPVSASP